MISPSEKYHRLSPNVEVRLRHAYWIKCYDYKCDALGNVIEVYCTYDPLTKGGISPPEPRKVKGTLHWVSTYDAIKYIKFI
jgi:glutaminyl-tRNA synthetase